MSEQQTTIEAEVKIAELVKVEEVNILDLFTGGGVDNLLKQIRLKVKKHPSDASTTTGRKEIASRAYAVSRAKVALDNAGKDKLAEEKAKLAQFDAERKKLRDGMDAIRDDVRRSLTQWEEKEKARLEAEALEAEKDKAWEEAYSEYDLRERERIIAEKEAELKRQEEAERLAREQKEREAQIAREAEAKAKQEAEEKARKEREAAEKALREAEEKVQRERERAEQAERDRIAAEARAQAEKEAAVREAEQKAKEEAERKERERLEAETKARAEAERKAANKRHRLAVQREAVSALIDAGVTEDDAKNIIVLIDGGAIPNVTINY